MENTSYKDMTDTQLDEAIAETQHDGAYGATSGGSPFTSDEKSETIINPEPELDGLQPKEVEPELTVESFGTPLEDFEVDNLQIALYESDEGADLAYAVEKNGGILTEELVEQAKTLGISDRQIDGYIAHQVQTANKVFVEAGMTLSEGRSLMQRMENSFSPEEKAIFVKEAKVDIVKSVKTLQNYFINEDK